MKEEILLTISILVSGRPETRKCLDSLKTLREQLPCELILTDTGCSEEMRGWLKEYTDQIYSFEWCDDFAAARNVGLKCARGSWFLYMDDDEWFDDTSGIINFFRSGEYKSYRSALYKVRNYGDREGINYKDSYVSRMCEIIEATEFKFPIHEVLMPGNGPVKYLDDFVHHFGYVYDSREEEQRKHERNLPLLLNAHKKEKHCLRHNAQLILEYYSMEKFESALEIANEGIRDYDSSFSMNGKMLNVCYASVVRTLNYLDRYEEAWMKAQTLVQRKDISALAVGFICGEAVFSCMKLNENKGLLYLKKYLLLKDVFDKDRECFLEQQTVVLEDCFDEKRYQWIMMCSIQLANRTGSKEDLKEIFERETCEWWTEAVRFYCSANGSVEVLELQEILADRKNEDAIIYYFYISLRETQLNCLYEDKGGTDEFWAMYYDYLESLMDYYKRMLSPRFIEMYPGLLPKDYRAAIHMKSAEQYRLKGDTVGVLKECRAAARIDTGMKKIIKCYADQTADKYKKDRERQRQENQEFWQLAEQIKKKIYKMLDKGQYDAAREALDQLKKLMPGDESLSLIEARLWHN